MTERSSSENIRNAIEAQRALASDLFDTMRDNSRDVEGVTRSGWSATEEAGAQLVVDTATRLGLEVEFDALGQVYATLPGKDRSASRVVIGSHLDSVQRGGNFDGFAGVVAGVIVLATLKAQGIEPAVDITVMGLRGEESVWYGIAYIGSRYAVGDIDWDELSSLVRVDSGKTLPDHLADLGYDVGVARSEAGNAKLTSSNTRSYLELHIEQGPLLDRAGVAIAVPTAIRGNARFPEISCFGRYGHASAEPLDDRRDAVLAAAELINGFDMFWQEQIKAGAPDTQLTVGRINTDATKDGLTVVPGECRFSFNFGGTTSEFIEAGRIRLQELADAIAAKRNVRFDLGRQVGSAPTPLNGTLRNILVESARELSIPCRTMATVGHDAAIFAKAGIPAAMILVRNQNGSHNPNEAMELDDFLTAAAVLAHAVLKVV